MIVLHLETVTLILMREGLICSQGSKINRLLNNNLKPKTDETNKRCFRQFSANSHAVLEKKSYFDKLSLFLKTEIYLFIAFTG